MLLHIFNQAAVIVFPPLHKHFNVGSNLSWHSV